MKNQIDMTVFAALVRKRRGALGLREAARQIEGVSPETLARVEQGKVPHLSTYVYLCHWIGIQTAVSLTRAETEHATALVRIDADPRADPSLSTGFARSSDHVVRGADEPLSELSASGSE